MNIFRNLFTRTRALFGARPLPEEQLGARPDEPDDRDWIAELPRDTTFSPSPGLSQYSMKPMNQGRTSACTGFAGTGFIYNLQCRLNRGRHDNTWRPAPLYLYWRVRNRAGWPNEDRGGFSRDVMKVLHKEGVVPYDHHPTDTDWSRVPAAQVRTQNVIRYFIKGYKRVPVNADTPSLLEYIIGHEKLPVYIGCRLYASMDSSMTRRNGEIQVPDRDSERLIGGHAMVIDDYDPHSRMLFILNSWGNQTGDRGRYYMPYEYVTTRLLTHDLWCPVLEYY